MRAGHRFIALFVAAVTLLGVMQLAGFAHHKQRRLDSNDTNGPLNVLSWGLRVGKKKVTCRARFFLEISKKHFADMDGFFCHFDHVGTDGREDAYVHVHVVEGDVQGDLYRLNAPSPTLVGTVPAAINRRKDTVVARIGKRRLRGRPLGIRWRGRTRFTNNSNCLTICEDFGPSSDGWFRYRR